MIEQGQLLPEDVFKSIEIEETVWVRIAATRNEDEWHQSLMEVVSGVAPSRWTQRRWDYDEAVFLSFARPGTEVAAWLRNEALTVDDLLIKLPTIQQGQTTQWFKYSSRTTSGGFETLSWPFTSYQLGYQPLKNGPGSGSLIGNGPSFVRFAQATASFFGFSLGTGASVDHMAPVFRKQDLSGRITKVRIDAADLEIHIEGSALEGMEVELASDDPGPSETLSSELEQVVRFPLSETLPSGAWIVLKKGTQWIDRKFINYPHTLMADPGVEMVVEPVTELEALVAGGEGATVEFKSQIPEPDTKLREKVCQTVAAFANGDGGWLLFGVADDGTIIGLPTSSDESKVRDTVTRFVTSMVTPLPNFSIKSIRVEGEPVKTVVVLTIDPGVAPPYGITPAKPTFYVRRGATTFPASSDQVRALARSRPQADQAYGSPYGLNLLK